MSHTFPQHIAIIMDGNGRWAEKKQHARIFGHTKGAKRVQELTRECSKIGIKSLTLYTFSTENWQRPKHEVEFLMLLLHRYILREREEIMQNNIRFQTIGNLKKLPPRVMNEIQQLQNDSAQNTGMILNLALSYGSREEITQAVQQIASNVLNKNILPEEIEENTIQQYLYTKNIPDPDLLIRTGGDHRISNFLLWQLAYTELYFTPVSWPDFTTTHFYEALNTYGQRERRFGLTSKQVQERSSIIEVMHDN